MSSIPPPPPSLLSSSSLSSTSIEWSALYSSSITRSNTRVLYLQTLLNKIHKLHPNVKHVKVVPHSRIIKTIFRQTTACPLRNLVCLNLSRCKITSVGSICQLDGLQTLNLSCNVYNLNGCTMLQHLDLSHNRITDVGHLSLSHLIVLKLVSNDLTNSKALDACANLEELDLSNTNFQFVLNNLKRLQSLNLSFNDISNFDSFNRLLCLKYLNLTHNTALKLSEIKIENLQYCLEILNLSSCELDFFFNFDNLQNLTHLNLSYNQLLRIENLHGFQNLEVLNLLSNNVSCIENLDNLFNLKNLNLSFNKLSSIDNISHLRNLKILNLAYNDISVVENFNPSWKLDELDLSHNKIKSINDYDLLSRVYFLNVSGNKFNKL